MKKTNSLFRRNHGGDELVRDEVLPGAEWVQAGEGVATRKLDGTCCLIQGGKLFRRYNAGKGRAVPPGFIPAQEPDPVTGFCPGWVAVGDGPNDKFHQEALAFLRESGTDVPDGTYELLGPKVQGNPEKADRCCLVRHCPIALAIEPEPPRDYNGLKAWLLGRDMEGIVWRHPDGRMVKIKKKDFGLRR